MKCLIIGPSIEVPKAKCVFCGKVLTLASGLNTRDPQPGDASICVGCGELMIFDQDLNLRNATSEEDTETMEGFKTENIEVYHYMQETRKMLRRQHLARVN